MIVDEYIRFEEEYLREKFWRKWREWKDKGEPQMKRTYTRKELKAICNALNKLSKIIFGYHQSWDVEADEVVLELQEINIDLKWNSEKQEFIV